MLKILELFAGSRSIGKAAESVGGGTFQVFSSDIESFKKIDYVVDILEFDYSRIPFKPNVIWASPPCTGFSVAAIGHHWDTDKPGLISDAEGRYIPRTETAKLGISIVKQTLAIIDFLKPEFFFIENPVGLLRKLPLMKSRNMIRHTVSYCQYGDARMKPTDIWTNNQNWNPRPMCSRGDDCHEAAPRGSKTGTQGLKDDYDRSKIPDELCREVLLSCITPGSGG